MSFTVRRTTPLAPEQAFAALTDVRRHAPFVPLTRAEPAAGPPHVGWFFDMVTGRGPLRVRDRMVVTAWEPGRRMRVVKTGRPIDGWADLRVRPAGAGAIVEWQVELGVRAPGLARLSRRVGDAVAPAMYAAVVDGVLAEAEAQASARASTGG
ncbi:MAG TPA: SRPBCC family protein [Dermatophilaceae bacterium]|nr:SRPBCC family protein [Dermatophilaceae bacterium]